MNANHVAGEYSGGLQMCVVCGEIITDHRGYDRMIDMETGKPPTNLRGFAEGPVYRIGNMTSIGRDESLPDCSPL